MPATFSSLSGRTLARALLGHNITGPARARVRLARWYTTAVYCISRSAAPRAMLTGNINVSPECGQLLGRQPQPSNLPPQSWGREALNFRPQMSV